MGTPVRETTPDLNLTAMATDEVVSPGHRFSIVLDIAPAAGTFLVGQGGHRYPVVALTLEPSENLRTYRMNYPEGTELVLAPQNERLPGYREAFRLVQDLAVVVNGETRQLAQKRANVELKGVLEYQACTEAGCSPPREIPLSWTLELRPLG